VVQRAFLNEVFASLIVNPSLVITAFVRRHKVQGRQQELHFVHHRHANCNFGVIHFFWDKILGTYRRPNAVA
jgi:sterol desaturase/sphingolipid hydroxylase (fatty acid hydroxylase superfamily)